MKDPRSESNEPLDFALQEFDAAWSAGQPPEIEAFLAAHADCGPELRERLEDYLYLKDALGDPPAIPNGEQGRERRRVRAALDRMDPLDGEILALRHVEQLTNLESAARLGLTEPAASQRYISALERVREALAEASDDPHERTDP